jgi:hypothetical protein
MRSLALLLVALTGLVAFEGCGSDSAPTGAQKPAAGTCNPAMCPVPATGMACCVGTYCGVNPNGQGCIPNPHPDAGVH